MGRVRNIILCGLLLAGFVSPVNLCRAGGKTSPEYLAVYSVSFGIKLNLETNSNASLNWQQVARYVDVDKLNRQLSSPRKLFVLQEQYVFITNKWIVSQARNRQAILVRTQPRTSYEGDVGRYLVCWNGNYEETFWMSEKDFQKNLKESGIILPTPDPVEVAAAKATVEQLIAREQIEHEMIIAEAPKLTAAGIREIWWERIKGIFIKPVRSSFEEDMNGTAQGGQIRPVPVMLAVLFLFGGGFLAVRWLVKRKSGANAHTQ